MNKNEYQNLAAETAFYPGRAAALPNDCEHGNILKCNPIPFPGYAYTALGLIGEFFEMSEICYPILSGEDCPTDYLGDHSEKRNDIVKELGDCWWYMSQLTMELGIPFSIIIPTNSTQNNAQHIHQDMGAIAELTKKSIRDHGGKPTPIQITEYIKRISNLYSFLCDICTILGISEEEIMETNIAKLRSRKERGVLGGSGDNR